MRKSLLLFLAILTSTSMLLQAQDFTPTLKWMGDLRVRSEVDWRDFLNSTSPNTYTLLRTRLALEALPVENVRVLIQARDSRVFGTEKDATGFNTVADTRNLDLHQGYIEAKKLFIDEFMIRLGRQELVYGSERMLGGVGWSNIGRVFDGGLARIDLASLSIDLFAMNTGEVQPYPTVATPIGVAFFPDTGSDFYGMYLTIKEFPGHKIDVYTLYQWNRSRTLTGSFDLSRGTVGSYAKGKFDSFDYEGELAYQAGARKGKEIGAFLISGAVGYSIPDMVLSRVGAGIDFLSGTEIGAAKDASFDPPFATGHKFYGFMDYFINIPAQTGGLGLMDAMLRATLTFDDKVSTNIWLHHFDLHQKDASGERGLGHELDITTLYKYNKNLSFEVGASAFVPGPIMRTRFRGDDLGLWGYLTTFVTF